MKFPTASGSGFWVLNGELHSPPSTPLGAMCLGQHQAAGHFGCAPVPTRLFASRAQKRLPSAGGRWCNLLSPPRSQKRAPSAGGRAGGRTVGAGRVAGVAAEEAARARWRRPQDAGAGRRAEQARHQLCTGGRQDRRWCRCRRWPQHRETRKRKKERKKDKRQTERGGGCTHSTATRTHRRTPTHAPAQVSPPERHSHSAACSQPAVATARLDCQPGVERGRLDSAHLALGDGIELGQEAAAVRKRRQGDQAAGRRAGRAAETKCILGAATCSVTRYLSGPVLKNAGESQSIQRSEHDHYVPEVVPRSPGQKAGRSAAPPRPAPPRD
jgi:hypothetical protein